MPNHNPPATKADLEALAQRLEQHLEKRLQQLQEYIDERSRDLQTEVLRAFGNYQGAQDISLRTPQG